LKNQDQASCCAACNRDPECTFWIWANPQETGSEAKMCWLMMGVIARSNRAARTSGGKLTSQGTSVTFSMNRRTNGHFFGTGGGGGTVSTLSKATNSDPSVENTQFFVPHFWNDADGYSALGVAQNDFKPFAKNHYPASWSTAGANQVQWKMDGSRADLYLSPATTAYDGMKTYWSLIGNPAKLPRYAHGFLACRWGWTDHPYILNILGQFRSGNFPIDGWISDFEWFTPTPDYTLPIGGSPTYKDFSYNSVTFPDPVNNLAEYHTKFNMRFGGIRKPRLGNSQALIDARSKGWALAGSRDLNYSIPAVRDFYATQLQSFLKDGVDFWWNDEGESFYSLFHYWNQAQVDSLNAVAPGRRFFSINRAYSPGSQRLGASLWTGDVPVTWAALANTPGYLLNWQLAGVGYVTCDIGGFSGPNDPPELLLRWYQVGVFMSIMRVHSVIGDTPHFPFLYPEPFAGAMRKALELRYQLIPTIYSLAHVAATSGVPIFRPLFFEWPRDDQALDITTQWLLGRDIMAAPVVSEGGSRSVYLPAGVFYEFNSTTTKMGPATFQLSSIAVDYIPIYCRTGAIVPLAPIVQFSDDLPGGPLNVQVYSGADGSFDMFEDDGETTAYQKEPMGGAAVRMTSFTWIDSSRVFNWKVMGTFSDKRIFTEVRVNVFFQNGSALTSSARSLGNGGTINF